ncbi:sigma-70 family RNA polymerase sigma factor [Limnoglobus roseus]|uniref:Sigma-70 family RNA polymerase sigma factor n=2 Tax=Limnoglobus roseus TaxID=2598579 RepID=A0A5C1AAP4_9BACT|nr:sigma-70 family RNA polymerase sigma factor [Limnoglobus roseus]
MDSNIPADRLSQISTMWTGLARRDDVQADESRAAAAAFLDRYYQAVYGYLLRSVKDPDRAAELFQEFALRFLKGDFRHADPGRGRFRDYLRTVLINLVRRSSSKPVNVALAAEPEVLPEEPVDGEFLTHWREAILNVAWQALQQEQNRGGPPYYSVLRLRAEKPDLTSVELAVQLTANLKAIEAYTDANVRKILQRGREVFSDKVVDEVARSIPTRDEDRVAQELIDLGFLGFCRKALDRWRVQ